ncbi:Membrane primary amine oxidase [Fusarium oxysporum f. sp. albedinis]|nr:Membrane primary amine oxidase [Fusarium oxysporum f. sp. albedinis]
MVNGLPKIIAATPHRHDIIERLVRDYRSSFSIMTRREGRSRKRPKMSPECRRNTGRPEPLKASNLAPMLSTTASTAASALLAQQDQAHRKQANPVTRNTHKVLGSPLSCCFFNSSSTLFIKEPMSTAAIDNEMYLGSRNPDAENLECHGHTQETKVWRRELKEGLRLSVTAKPFSYRYGSNMCQSHGNVGSCIEV